MYRIISGKWKAKKIVAPKHFDVRPTTDFAKEALFSIIENTYDLDFCSVLDLYAGIGSISLELASRNCKDITAVDLNAKHVGFISTTAAELDMTLQIITLKADVADFLKKNRKRKSYDLVFADPPFETDDKTYEELISLVLNNEYLKENGVFILEHKTKTKFSHPQLQITRKYGNVSFSFFKAVEKQVITEG